MLDVEQLHNRQDDALDHADLRRENDRHGGTPGVSEECRGNGFLPAFLDRETGTVYPSCYADGSPAPFHMLDGLPDTVVVRRREDGTVEAVKHSLQSGFVKSGVFYTRDQAARRVAMEDTA